MNEEEFEELLEGTPFPEREKKRLRREWIEADHDTRLDIKEALLSQQCEEE